MHHSARIEAVLQFFENWERGWEVFVRSHFDFFTDNCAWENSGMPTTYGPQEAYEKIHLPSREALGMNGIRVDVLNIAEIDGRVWSERIDHILDESGSVVMSLPLVGLMEFADDGRLRHWREYFDPAPISAHAQPEPTSRGC